MRRPAPEIETLIAMDPSMAGPLVKDTWRAEGKNIFVVVRGTPIPEADPCIGTMLTPELAAFIAYEHNIMITREQPW